MSDVEAIGVILDDLIEILQENVIYDDDKYNKYCINLLKYVEYLCSQEGIDLDMENKLDKEVIDQLI